VRRTRPFIVPVCVDDTPETDADVPDSFSAAQWTRLHNGDTRRAFVERDLRLLSPEAAYAPGEVRSPAAPVLPPTGAAPRLRRLLPRRDKRSSPVAVVAL
jgi:hypothetical protein